MSIAANPFWAWSMLLPKQSEWAQPPKVVSRQSFFQARNAIYHSLDVLGIEKGSRVLAPSYICRAAIDPLLAYGLDVDFYAVNRDCLIDITDLERRITPQTSAVLAVHYFGFPQPLARLRALCNTHGLALIEDCAHVLVGEVEDQPMGSVGDAAVFSWRKFLPVYDGADLVINRGGAMCAVQCTTESGLFTLKVASNMVETTLVHARTPLTRLAYRSVRGAEHIFRACVRRRLRNSAMMQAEMSAICFDPQTVHWPMSRLSMWTRKHCNIAKIVETRRRHYQTLLAELSVTAGLTPLVSKLPALVCPWVFPVFVNRPNAHVVLRERGIPAATWGGVRHPQLTVGEFADSDLLYDQLVFLPIHQSLIDEEIVEMARAVREVCV